MQTELSTMDIKILEELQKDATLSTAELAERVGSSQSPCWRRLQRLREEGYIRREVALVDRTRLGESFFIISFVKVATLGERERAELLRAIELTPQITECYSVFGDADLLIKVLTPSMDWYQSFLMKTLLKLPGVQSVQSTVTLQEIKYTTAIPVRGSRAL